MEDPLKKYNLPSRAQLGMDSLFAATSEQRAAAKALLAMLKEAGVKEYFQERRDSIWKVGFPPPEIMALSPAGRRTLELLGNTPKETETKGGETEPVAPVAPESATAEPADDTNEYMRRLNWPPRSTQPPQPQIEEPPQDSIRPRFVAGRPSTADSSQQPLAPEDFDNNRPIY
jgi:hypothetical protein